MAKNKDLDTIKKLQKLIDTNPKQTPPYQAVEDLFEMLRVYAPKAPKKVHKWNEDVRKVSARQAHFLLDKDLSTAEKYYSLNKRSLLFDAPVDLDAYLQYVEFDREPKRRFYLPRRAIIRPIVHSLQDLEDDKLDLLSLSMPPGTGKSTLGIFFLSWIMGKYPDQPNLASGHSDKLTRGFYDGVLNIITDPEYLWADVFPGVQVADVSAKDEAIDLGKPKRFKTLTCRSIDGSLTGATRCEKYLYADDLVSGIEEALSKTRLDALWEKYVNDLKSRKKLGCKEIHIATRWSVHDPVGRLERQYENDPRAEFLAFPALNVNDESMFSYKFGVGFDTKYFLDMRDILDDVSWRCLFQNQPIEREGLLYSEDELNRYYEKPEIDPDAIIGICDTAEGGGDYTFLPVAYQYGQSYYIDDCVCDNGTPTITDPLCAKVLLDNKVHECQFESNSAGGRTADKVRENVMAHGGRTHITKKRTTSNKETRIIVNSTYVKEHFLFKDASTYKPNSPYGTMVRQLTEYTVAGKNPHDDVPDGMSLLVDFIMGHQGSIVEVMPRPF